MIGKLANAMIENGIPEYIRSNNGSDFIAKDLRSWLSGIRVKTAFVIVLTTLLRGQPAGW